MPNRICMFRILGLFLTLISLYPIRLEAADCQRVDVKASGRGNVSVPTTYNSRASDFTLNTTTGSFSFKDQGSSCDVYIFLKTFTVAADSPLKPLADLTNTLWNSTLDYMIQYSPKNVHYFFVSQNLDAKQRGADISVIQGHLQAALAALPAADQAFWANHIHIVDDDLTSTDAAWIGSIGPQSFVIDRSQLVRPLGVGVYSQLLDDGDLLKLAMEADYSNFLWDRDQRLNKQTSVKVIKAFDNELVQAGWTEFGGKINEVQFPPADEMNAYDSLSLDLTLSCPKGQCVYDSGQYYYDRIVEVFLCRDEADVQCDTEVGRWITPFGTGGRWVTDVSPLLALVHQGGKQRFRFHTVDGYNVSLDFRLNTSRRGGAKPFAYQELFRGGKLLADYNTRDPMVVNIPEGTTKIELYSVTSGHGWGRDAENCAEFCVTDHEWTINDGTKWLNSLSQAGDTFACFLSAGSGVIPNQPGTWYYGRSGWCPGLEVKPVVWDVTSQFNLKTSNLVRYRALYKGGDYVPTRNPDGGEENGYPPEINLRSYLVFSR